MVFTKNELKMQREMKRLHAYIDELEQALAAKVRLPELPPADSNGGRPALAAIDVVIARKLITMRLAAGLTQLELAERAGVRVETICRLETGKHSPNLRTVEKIERALTGATNHVPPKTTNSKPLRRPAGHGKRAPKVK